MDYVGGDVSVALSIAVEEMRAFVGRFDLSFSGSSVGSHCSAVGVEAVRYAFATGSRKRRGPGVAGEMIGTGKSASVTDMAGPHGQIRIDWSRWQNSSALAHPTKRRAMACPMPPAAFVTKQRLPVKRHGYPMNKGFRASANIVHPTRSADAA